MEKFLVFVGKELPKLKSTLAGVSAQIESATKDYNVSKSEVEDARESVEGLKEDAKVFDQAIEILGIVVSSAAVGMGLEVESLQKALKGVLPALAGGSAPAGQEWM